MSKLEKKELSKKIKNELNRIIQEADATRKYRWAIDEFEKYEREYKFDSGAKYKLGLLYDHLVIFKILRFKDVKKKNTLKKKYLDKAEKIYEEILKEEKNNLFAFRGLARVYETQGRYKQAIKYAEESYEIMKKLPKEKRGVLGIGGFYESIKDYKGAERWYKKELKLLGNKDFGSLVNLINFYKRQKRYKEALPYTLEVEKIFKKMFPDKKIIEKNKTLKGILNSIIEIKRKAGL